MFHDKALTSTLGAMIAACGSSLMGTAPGIGGAPGEGAFLANTRQLVFEGRRAGEGYFSADGSKMIFQSEREPDNPFYQIYIMDLDTGDTRLVSPGKGKTTCAWFHPEGGRVLFSSTHEDPDAVARQEAELALRASGKSRRYSFDFEEHFDIYEAREDGTILRNLTQVRGYDAEGSYSPDGNLIAFSSNRHAYAGTLSEADQKRLEESPQYYLDIYIMNADRTNVRRLTDVRGYDGGPFFSPDGKRLCWRRFSEDGQQAEIWTMNVDGSDQRQVTRLGAMSWAPFYHPSGDYIIFNTDLQGRGNFELYTVDVDGTREPVRVTYTAGADLLAVFAPDGRRLAWTSTRTADGQAQIFMADWDDAAARGALGIGSRQDASRTSAARDPAGGSVAAVRPELPATSPEITADDIVSHCDALGKLLRGNDSDASGSMRAVTDYVAATFGRLGLEPAGEHATLFQLCQFPLLATSADDPATREVGCNVLGRLRAEGAHDRQALVIGAHIAESDGASDDRSRVAAVAGLLEIAEYLSGQRDAGRLQAARDVVFAAFIGEPLSAAFVAEGFGVFMQPEGGSRRGIAAYLGLGEIGQAGGPVTLCGVGSSPFWRREIERRNVPIGLPLTTQDAPQPETTGLHFYMAGVPALNAYTAPAKAGEPATFSDERALKVTRLMTLIAGSILSTDAAPPFTVVSERQGAVAGRAYLGTEPDYRGGGSVGVKLQGVTAGGPADRAGLQPGDVIVEVNSRAIGDVNDYAAVLDELRIGEEVSIIVQRGGERLELRITVGSRR